MSTAFIDLQTAAKRSGKSVGHLARIAANKWRSEGKAEMRRPATGGKPTWFVREDADSALAAIKMPEHIGVDLRQYTQAQRDEAFRRRDLLDAWDEFCRHSFAIGYDRVRATNTFVQRQLIDKGVTISRATLYNWQKLYRAGGLSGLIDGRGRANDSGKDANSPDPFLAEVQRLYLHLSQPKLANMVRMAEYTARERGWTIRSYKTCQRHINTLPAGLIIKMRLGEDAYVAKAEPYIEKDYSTIDSNFAWTADHHQMDVIVNHGGELVRPWLSVFMDIRSRKIVGWSIVPHAPNSDLIISVFRSAVLAHGVPHSLYIDNGKDYDCYALNGRTKRDRWAKKKMKITLNGERADGIFPQLGVKVCHVWPYHGQSKPVEPWFKNPEEANRSWATYCGNNPGNKPEDLQLQLERGNAPSLQTYTAWFGDWLAAWDAGHPHSGSGMEGKTPDCVFVENLRTKQTADENLLDLLCLRRVGPIKVGRNGVQWQGIRFGQYEPALNRLLGTEVYLRVDERIVGHVQVYTDTDKFICMAQSNEKLPWGANHQDLRAAIAENKKDRKLLRTYIDRRPHITEDAPDRLVRALAARAAQAQRDNPTPPPAHSIQPVRHPLEAALPAIQRAVDAQSIKQAVGAESVPLPSKFIYQSNDKAEEQTPSIGMSFAQLMAGRDALNKEAP